jgi:hypothetical protein
MNIKDICTAVEEELVSIDQMGQALLTSLVQMHHVARGQVSRVFEDEVYDLLFVDNSSYRGISLRYPNPERFPGFFAPR